MAEATTSVSSSTQVVEVEVFKNIEENISLVYKVGGVNCLLHMY